MLLNSITFPTVLNVSVLEIYKRWYHVWFSCSQWSYNWIFLHICVCLCSTFISRHLMFSSPKKSSIILSWNHIRGFFIQKFVVYILNFIMLFSCRYPFVLTWLWNTPDRERYMVASFNYWCTDRCIPMFWISSIYHSTCTNLKSAKSTYDGVRYWHYFCLGAS